MGHSVRVQVGSSSGRVMFGLSNISGHFGLGRVWFGWVNQIWVRYARHAKTSNFVENFGSDMVQFESIRVSSPLSGEYILGVGLGIVPTRSVWVLGLGSVLPGLPSDVMYFSNFYQIVRPHPLTITEEGIYSWASCSEMLLSS